MDEFSAKRQALLAAGVRMMDPSTVYVEESVTVGPGTLLLPGTILRGKTAVGAGCEIGPNTMLVDCTVGDHVTINSSDTRTDPADFGAAPGGKTLTLAIPVQPGEVTAIFRAPCTNYSQVINSPARFLRRATITKFTRKRRDVNRRIRVFPGNIFSISAF